jgi:hypothetical protein
MSSPFASHTTSDPIPLPFDAPNWVQVRKLTGRELEQAAASGRDLFLGGNGRMFPALLRRALEHGATDPDVLHAIRDPLTGYDRYALVRFGLIAWSYPAPIVPRTFKEIVEGLAKHGGVFNDAIDDLDDEAVDFIATEVLRLTKPHLFHVTEADAAIEKKTADDPASVVGWEGTAAV